MDWIPLLLFVFVVLTLLAGYPVAFTLAGTSLLFALVGTLIGVLDSAFIQVLPNRVFGIMTNETLIAVPLFVFMGVMLERSQVAEKLLESMALLFGPLRGGLGFSVTLVGMLLAASTGIVGATVVTMGLLSLPTMLKRGYSPQIASGTICASGTLGQIIPPSIVLVLLGDVLSSAYQQAQLNQGIYSPDTVSVGDLFAGAIIPGLVLVLLYLLYLAGEAWLRPQGMPAISAAERDLSSAALGKTIVKALAPPLLLMIAVLGSIMGGVATPTEAASVGAIGAILLAAANRKLTLKKLEDVMRSTVQITSMVFLILIGASVFTLVFRGFGGDDAVHALLTQLPGRVIRSDGHSDADHVFPGLCARFYRNYIRRCAHRRAGTSDAGCRSRLARNNDRPQSSNFVSYPTLRIRLVLFARSGAFAGEDAADILRRSTVYSHSAFRLSSVGAMARNSDLVTLRDIWCLGARPRHPNSRRIKTYQF